MVVVVVVVVVEVVVPWPNTVMSSKQTFSFQDPSSKHDATV